MWLLVLPRCSFVSKKGGLAPLFRWRHRGPSMIQIHRPCTRNRVLLGHNVACQVIPPSHGAIKPTFATANLCSSVQQCMQLYGATMLQAICLHMAHRIIILQESCSCGRPSLTSIVLPDCVIVYGLLTTATKCRSRTINGGNIPRCSGDAQDSLLVSSAAQTFVPGYSPPRARSL
ncbi:hypothetical protein FIBSPDRAFT_224374 [Athelia psychrophila]|uniref:Uncharacterized protein n=1 Tax=Athelia psychrophila TaxID=1759441 RepID=A0A166S5Y0_9AGAM|nr:hypothetical protein FIBSPDRAFT_224374 [Fibularhizoctonia sp. CBS 109695]